jgi:signal recognition particle receptor subunit beta
MSLINHRSREIHVKIVYYGPGMGGKTTNVQKLHERLPDDRRGRLVSIATEQERTLFFDFMPVALGAVNGFTTRIHLYTVPGQIYYRRSRRAVLQGVDGLVFVADSQPHREADNAESMADMLSLLGVLGFSAAQIARLPRVIQYNKRDVAGALPIERMRAALNPDGLPEFEAVAKDGVGVPDTMRAITKAVLARFGPTAAAPPPSPPPASPPPATPAPRSRTPKPTALTPTRR